MSSCIRLPTISVFIMLGPVTLPPGRARLATRPRPTGSPSSAITMGIVEVASFAALAEPLVGGHDDIHLELNQFYGKLGRPLLLSLGIAIYQHEVFAFDVAEVPKSLQERVAGIWDYSSDASTKITDPRYLFSLLGSARRGAMPRGYRSEAS